MEDYYFLLNQERLYIHSEFIDKRWYRKLYGGKWRYMKMGKDTPYIGMFCTWTKMPDKCWSGYFEVLDTENFEITGVDTKKKLINRLIKNVFSYKKKRKPEITKKDEVPKWVDEWMSKVLNN